MNNTVIYSDSSDIHTAKNIIVYNGNDMYIEGPNKIRVYFKDIAFNFINTSMSTLDLTKGEFKDKCGYEPNTGYFCIHISTHTDIENFRNGELLHQVVYSFDDMLSFNTVLYILNTFKLIGDYTHKDGELSDERFVEIQNYKNLNLM